MPVTVDTDYTAYVIFAYGAGAVGLIGLTVWTVLRLMSAQRKLAQAEKDEAQ